MPGPRGAKGQFMPDTFRNEWLGENTGPRGSGRAAAPEDEESV
jgi:hypothetical protein